MAIHYIKPGIDASKLYDTINSLTGVSNTSEALESISYPNSAVKFDDELWKGKDGRFLFYHRVVVDSSTSPATHIHVFVPGSKYVEALGAFLTSSSWAAGGNTSLIGTINLINQIDPSVTNSFYVGNSYKTSAGLEELFQNGIDNFVTSTETTFADVSSFKMIKLDKVNLAGESLVDNLPPNAQSNQFIFVMWKQSNSNYCVNFNGGGGLSQQKLSKTTTDPAEVLSGETFYSKDKNVKTGTLPHHPEHHKTISTVHLGDYLGYKIPRGGYTHAEPWVRAEKPVVAKAIGLTADKIVEGNTVLGITGTGGFWGFWGYFGQIGDDSYLTLSKSMPRTGRIQICMYGPEDWKNTGFGCGTTNEEARANKVSESFNNYHQRAISVTKGQKLVVYCSNDGSGHDYVEYGYIAAFYLS